MIDKRMLLSVHRWIGIPLALLMVVQALTGMALVFRDELEPIVHPELRVEASGPRVPVQALIDTAQNAHPEATVSRVEVPQSAAQAVLLKLQDDGHQRLVAVDPYRNVIVHDGFADAWPLEWIFMIHYELLAGPSGEQIVAIEGALLLLLAITGPIVWWPAGGRLRQGFRVKLDATADLRWRTLHRAVGAGAAAFLIVMAVTGALMVWKDPLRAVLRPVATVQIKPVVKVAERPGVALMPVDAMVAKAQLLYDAPLRQVRFAQDRRFVGIYLDRTDTVRPDAMTQVYFDGYTGAELGRYVPGTLSAATEVIDWFYTVHTGVWGGLFGRVLAIVVGVVLVGLSITGVWLWWTRTAKKRRNKAARAAVVAGN